MLCQSCRSLVCLKIIMQRNASKCLLSSSQDDVGAHERTSIPRASSSLLVQAVVLAACEARSAGEQDEAREDRQSVADTKPDRNSTETSGAAGTVPYTRTVRLCATRTSLLPYRTGTVRTSTGLNSSRAPSRKSFDDAVLFAGGRPI